MDTSSDWDFLGKRVAVVSPFPPARDGIARYAQQLVEALASGRELIRVGLRGGGDRTADLLGWLRPLKLLALGRGFDDLLVMYHPHYYVRRYGFLERLAGYASLLAVSRLRPITFVVHEIDEPPPQGVGRRGRAEFAVEERLRRRLWAGVDRVVFHSEWERGRFAERFPGGRRRGEQVVDPGAFFTTQVAETREDVRQRLGLSAEAVVLLMIGFLSPDKPDKGYDRAIRAVGEAGLDHLELHIVGSPIRPGPDVDRFLEGLRELVDASRNVHLHEQFVSDEDFDRWIRAADAVLVPYRESSSSGVVARTHLLGTTLIASGVGGMGQQLAPGDLRFSTDAELVERILEIARRT